MLDHSTVDPYKLVTAGTFGLFPWLLLCNCPTTNEKVLYICLIDSCGPSLEQLSGSFSSVFLCTLNSLSFTNHNLPENVTLGQLDPDSFIFPYPDNFFDMIVMHGVPRSKKKSLVCFSELQRMLHPKGCLFFCFANSLSYQRIKSLLGFSVRKQAEDAAGSGDSLNTFSCKRMLRNKGFSAPHFYSFASECSCVSAIRDCNELPRSRRFSTGLALSPKRLFGSLRSTSIVRNLFYPHYGVIAGRQSRVNIDSVPAMIASAMCHDFPRTSWRIWDDTFDITRKGTFVFTLYDSGTQQKGVCKIPLNHQTKKHLEDNYSALERINQIKLLPDSVRKKIPAIITRSQLDDYLYFVEDMKDGAPAVRYIKDRANFEKILLDSANIITEIHKSTSCESSTDPVWLLDGKIKQLRMFKSLDDSFINDLERFLRPSFADVGIFVTSKGDCSANNILVDKSCEVSAVIDWDQSQEISFPLVDVVNLLESFRRNYENKSMGEVLVNLFFKGERTEVEDRILGQYCTCFSLKKSELIPYAILYWIDHVIAQDYTSILSDERWLLNNVIYVVDYMKNNIFSGCHENN